MIRFHYIMQQSFELGEKCHSFMKTSSLVVSGKYSNQFLNLRACLFGCRVLEIMKLILVSQFILSTCHIIREHFFQIVFLFLLGIKSNKKVKSPRRLSYQLFWIIYSNTSKILILLRSLIWTYPGTNSHSMKSVHRNTFHDRNHRKELLSVILTDWFIITSVASTRR